MKKTFLTAYILLFTLLSYSQSLLTTFDRAEGKQTTTYADCIQYYEKLDKDFNTILIKKFNTTDAGYLLHLVLYSGDNNFNVNKWQNDKVIILVSNGIHAGEPDGIDASMMLARDLATGKIKAPENVVIAFIAVYNIGGALNRNSFSRVN
jgi:hypothetical protein